MIRTELRLQEYLALLICDRCGREADRGNASVEFHEFTRIQFRAGYGSVFGDGNEIQVDLCQHCLKDTLGAWIRVTDPYVGLRQELHGDEFPNESEKHFHSRARVAIDRAIENDDGVPAEQVIAKLEERLANARSELLQREAKVRSSLHPTSQQFGVGSPVVTNTPLPNLDLDVGAHGSIVRIHDASDLIDVAFVMDADGTTSIKTVDATWLTPWKLI